MNIRLQHISATEKKTRKNIHAGANSVYILKLFINKKILIVYIKIISSFFSYTNNERNIRLQANVTPLRNIVL